MIASKLKPGDEIRIIAPSRNLTEVRQDVHHHAVDFWEREGFRLTFSKNSSEVNQFHSSSIAARAEDKRIRSSKDEMHTFAIIKHPQLGLNCGCHF